MKAIRQNQTNWIGHWNKAWRIRVLKVQFVVTWLMLFVAVYLTGCFLRWIETRSGSVISDPILAMLPPKDFSWEIFGLIYIAIAFGIYHLSFQPWAFLRALQAYTLLLLTRIISIYAFPLAPPAGLIPLKDPIVSVLNSGEPFTKDLFFSGHIATLFLLFLVARNRLMRISFFISTCMVGLLMLWQHVHYSVDVLFAPFFAYAIHRFCRGVISRMDQ